MTLLNFCISNRDGSGEECHVKALEFATICSSLSISIDVQQYPHLRGLRLAEDFDQENSSVDILIGSDYYWTFMTGNIVRGERGPVAIESTLGWVLSGTAATKSQGHDATVLILSSEIGGPGVKDELSETLEKFWSTESIGITSDGIDDESQADYRQFLQELNSFTAEGLA